VADSLNDRIRKIGPDGIIDTIAGGRDSGDRGAAALANIYRPRELSVGPDGAIFVLQEAHSRIRKITPQGIIDIFAGSHPGFSGDGGAATSALLSSPLGASVGPDGSVYVADTANHRIRKISREGIINTIAGTGEEGYFPTGDGVAATEAKFWHPTGVAIAPDGSIFVADTNNNRIRKIGTDGIIDTLAEIFQPVKLALGPDGSLFVLGRARIGGKNRILEISSDGSIKTLLEANIESISVLSDGTLYFTDVDKQNIGVLSPPYTDPPSYLIANNKQNICGAGIVKTNVKAQQVADQLSASLSKICIGTLYGIATHDNCQKSDGKVTIVFSQVLASSIVGYGNVVKITRPCPD